MGVNTRTLRRKKAQLSAAASAHVAQRTPSRAARRRVDTGAKSAFQQSLEYVRIYRTFLRPPASNDRAAAYRRQAHSEGSWKIPSRSHSPLSSRRSPRRTRRRWDACMNDAFRDMREGNVIPDANGSDVLKQNSSASRPPPQRDHALNGRPLAGPKPPRAMTVRLSNTTFAAAAT